MIQQQMTSECLCDICHKYKNLQSECATLRAVYRDWLRAFEEIANQESNETYCGDDCAERAIAIAKAALKMALSLKLTREN